MIKQVEMRGQKNHINADFRVLTSKAMTVNGFTVWSFPQITTAVLTPTPKSLTSAFEMFPVSERKSLVFIWF